MTTSTNIRGDRVRAMREKADLRQYELAVMAGVSQGHLSQIETGHIESVGSYILAGLARALETNVDYLVGTSDDPRPPKRARLGALRPDEEELLKDYRTIRDESFKTQIRTYVRMMQDADRRLAAARQEEARPRRSARPTDSGPDEENTATR